MNADRERSTRLWTWPFLYYVGLGLLPVWVVAGYIVHDARYGLTLPWMLLFLPVTFLMAAMGFAAHVFLRRSLDAISSYALGTTVYFAVPLIAFLVTRVL